MQLAVFILLYPLLWLVSRLPFKLIYWLSDFVFYWIYHVFGYRKKVVNANLKLVFPEKTNIEILGIQENFYRHLCDMFLEMIKTMGISNTQLQKRFTFSNLEVLHELEKKGESIMLMFPHYASWEWVIALDAHIQSRGYAIYQPINNRYFDKLVRDIREKYGTGLISTKETNRIVIANKDKGQLSMYGILSDQSPMISKSQYFTDFMGVTVPVHTGAESLCKRHNLPAVYLKVRKLKRGHYEGSFKVLAQSPLAVDDYQITKAFLNEVEQSIYEAPEYYFWTHKRWKHRNKIPTKKKSNTV